VIGIEIGVGSSPGKLQLAVIHLLSATGIVDWTSIMFSGIGHLFFSTRKKLTAVATAFFLLPYAAFTLISMVFCLTFIEH
jgi:hypothetical protein